MTTSKGFGFSFEVFVCECIRLIEESIGFVASPSYSFCRRELRSENRKKAMAASTNRLNASCTSWCTSSISDEEYFDSRMVGNSSDAHVSLVSIRLWLLMLLVVDGINCSFSSPQASFC